MYHFSALCGWAGLGWAVLPLPEVLAGTTHLAAVMGSAELLSPSGRVASHPYLVAQSAKMAKMEIARPLEA